MSVKEIGNGIVGVLIENGKLSIGRTMLLVTFFFAVGRWSLGLDIPPTHLNVLLAMLAYVLGSKVVGNVSDTVKKINEAKTIVMNTVNDFKEGNTNVSNITDAVNDISDIAKEVIEDITPPANMQGDN